MKRIMSILFLAALMLSGCAGSVFAEKWIFDNKDVKGTWSIQSFSYDNATGYAGWLYGSIKFDDKGRVVGGRGVDWQGETITITGGTYTLGRDGTVNMTVNAIEQNGGNITVIAKGTMDMSKDTMGLVGTNTISNSIAITILVKKPEVRLPISPSEDKQ